MKNLLYVNLKNSYQRIKPLIIAYMKVRTRNSFAAAALSLAQPCATGPKIKRAGKQKNGREKEMIKRRSVR